MSRVENPRDDDALATFGAAVAAFVAGRVAHWRPYKGPWCYEDGCFWLGALRLAEASGQRRFSDFAYREVSPRIDGDGVIAGYAASEFNIDNVLPARAVLALARATGEPRLRAAVRLQLAQLDTHPRTASGNFWHKRIYPYQVWLDGLYMAQPLRCEWARDQDDAGVVADVLAQFEVVWQRMRDPASGLPWHGWDESGAERWADAATGCSPNLWSRALGWYVMALVDCVDALARLAPAAAARLADMLVQTVAALRPHAIADGRWLQLTVLPQVPGNYPESSATLMIAYALMKGARLGVLDADAGAHGRRAFDAVVTHCLDADRLTGICGVAGLGNVPYRDGSVAYYLSEPQVDNDPKGVAAFFLALSEALRAAAPA